jgi:hypothetical protein
MKKIAALIFAFVLLRASGATITFTVTNSIGQPDQHPFQVLPLSTPLVFSNSYFITGLPIQLQPDTNGFCQTNLLVGQYAVTNQFFVNQFAGGSSRGVIFTVTNNSGTYSFASLVSSNAYQFAWNPAVLPSGVVATNSPFNGAALRYTNGIFYWAQ